ncbi:MAG TPA: SRPBCC family protein [Gaiellaceae bacterium]|nr:SRPBCC family protein [Gaiellaceae bacterium]
MSDEKERATETKAKVKDKAAETKDAVKKTAEKLGGDGGGDGSSLLSKLAVPAAAAAGTLVSSYAAKKLPDLLRGRGLEDLKGKGLEGAESLGKRAVEGAQGAAAQSGGLAGKAAERLLGGGGDGEGQPAKGWGRGRRLPIQCSVDVAVPVKVAYDQWTQFEDFPEFMHRAERVEQRDDQTVAWHENVWGVSRSWEAQIVEQVPDERIAWRSDSRGGQSGVVTFHELSDRLTRVELNIDFQPQGVFEKLASGLRFHRRAIKTDLQRYKAFVEMRNEETGAWRGEIHDEDENPAREATKGHDNSQASNGDSSSDESSRKEREERRQQRRKAATAK